MATRSRATFIGVHERGEVGRRRQFGKRESGGHPELDSNAEPRVRRRALFGRLMGPSQLDECTRAERAARCARDVAPTRCGRRRCRTKAPPPPPERPRVHTRVGCKHAERLPARAQRLDQRGPLLSTSTDIHFHLCAHGWCAEGCPSRRASKQHASGTGTFGRVRSARGTSCGITPQSSPCRLPIFAGSRLPRAWMKWAGRARWG
jgi:hypothetical protein